MQTALSFATTMPFVLVALVLGVIGALKGLSRGAARQLVRVITIVVSVILALLATNSAYKQTIDFVGTKSPAEVGEFFQSMGLFAQDADMSWIESLDPASLQLVCHLFMSLFVAPICFVLAFIVISGLMLIVHGVLSTLFGFSKRRNNFITRIAGMALGFVQGVAVTGIILMPLIGLGNAFGGAVDTLNREAPDNEATKVVTDVWSDIEPITKDPCFSVLGPLGINALYENIATVEIDGKDHNMTELFPDIALIIGEAVKLDGADFKNLTPENEQAVKNILDIVEDDEFLTRILASAIKTAAYAYKNGAIDIKAEAPFDSIIDSAISIFETTDPTNVNRDLDTVAEVFFILSREGVLSSIGSESSALLNALTKRDEGGKTAVNKVIDVISANERTKPLVTLLAKLSITVMSQQAGLSPEMVDVYDNVKTGLNDEVLQINKDDYATDEEYVEAVSGSLDTVLKQNNIELEPEIVDTMAEYISEHHSELSEITDDEINDIILSYYDAYLDYLENGTVPDGVLP
ncbi:MAG: CvpA family protein [Clostridia bacterium]|nr:CvpA family protein [Clostridia bacterium]